MIKIFYNEIDAFSPYPTPLVSLDSESIYYGEKWGERDALTLNGQITGCSFESVLSGYNLIKSRFSRSYKPFSITQDNKNIYYSPVAEITDFNIGAQNFLGVLNYNVNLNCYPQGSFSGVYGVLNPSDEWSISEESDYRGSVVRRISCQGFNTSSTISNALDNAKNWVLSKTGVGSFIQPALLGQISEENLCLLKREEQIDRFNASYSITDTYTTDLTRSGYGVLRYTTEIDSGNSLISVALNGSVEGCGQNLSGARQVFKGLDKYATALYSYNNIFGKKDLNPIPLSFSVNEDELESKIDFSYQFDNDPNPETYFDYTVTLSSGDSISVSLGGDIISRGGSTKSKLEKSLLYASQIKPFEIANEFYKKFYPNFSLAPLNSNLITSAKQVNERNGNVRVSFEFGNSVFLNGFESIDYNISISPQLRKFDSQIKIGGSGIYSVVDLGYSNRASLSLRGNAVALTTTPINIADRSIRNFANTIFQAYGNNLNTVFLNKEVNFSRFDKRIVDFNFSWSFDSNEEVILGENYSEIDTLKIK